MDIVIPVGPNDHEKVKLALNNAMKYVQGYRNIYLICPDDMDITCDRENVTIIRESSFPFSIKDVANAHGTSFRNGWYLQQLLKLYAIRILPNSPNFVLIIDADTFFLRPVCFTKKDDTLGSD